MTEPAGWGEFLAQAMQRAHYKTAAELSRDTGIGESLISRWLRGVSQPEVENLRRLVQPLRIPMLRLLVAAGHVTAEEVKLRDTPVAAPREPSLAEVVERDPSLVGEAKEHLIRQYGLLRRLSEVPSTQETAPTQPKQRPLRSVARPREKRRTEQP